MQRIENISKEVKDSQSFSNLYSYTQNQRHLTMSQRLFYERNGYVIVKNVVKESECDMYITRFLEYCHDKVEEKLPGMAVVRDISKLKEGKQLGENAIIKLQDWQDDEILMQFCQNNEVLNYVSDIIGDNIKTAHTMMINKPPNIGKTQRHPLHQDLAYFPFRPAEKIVCSWMALEKVNRDNGGLVVYPGTHKWDFLEHGYPDWKEGVNRGYWGILDKYMPDQNQEKIYLELEKGDCVFFHPLLIHGSGQNKTQNFRKSISCHYASSECQFIDVKGTNNEGIANDIVDWTKKYHKLDLNFEAIWRAKMRLVRGEEFEGDRMV